ncbi:hypothetical protein RGV33_32775, partial [Pseudomonas sp. Bout1]|uniref:hypothetical protein n=1 Tax=Pseudomonas sp. Bout1 TaxID=3048600 RepID=UPI002AB34A32
SAGCAQRLAAGQARWLCMALRIWLVARRLNHGKFHRSGIWEGSEMELDTSNSDVGLDRPSQRAGSGGAITLL